MESASRAPLVPETAPTSSCRLPTKTIRKLDWGVLLPCVAVVVIAYVDRSNIGYAAQDLCNDLQLTHEEYGFGVSLFCAGYWLTQLFGNVLLRRLGAPTWMAVMIFAWGCVATAFGFIQNTMHFYVLRVLLGLAEGGTFPAVWNYLSLFYPKDHITGAYIAVIAAVAFSMPLSAPVSSGLLSLGDAVGMQGWRLLFIGEGLIPISFSIYLYLRLPVSLETVSFLDTEELQWIASRLSDKHAVSRIALLEEVKTVLLVGPWWLGTASHMLCFGVSNIILSWATLIIHNMLYGDDDENSGTCGSGSGETALSILLTAVPYSLAGTMCLFLRGCNIRNRSRFAAVVGFLGGAILISWGLRNEVSFLLGFLLLTCSLVCGHVAAGPRNGLTLSFFDASTHATASALYDSMATVSGLIFPPLVGRLIDGYGWGAAVSAAGGATILAAISISFVRDPLSTPETTPEANADRETRQMTEGCESHSQGVL